MTRYKWAVIECLGPDEAVKALNEAEGGLANQTHVIFTGLGHDKPHPAIHGASVPIVPVFHVFARFPMPPGPDIPMRPENTQPA